jgi:hypothetical protein
MDFQLNGEKENQEALWMWLDIWSHESQGHQNYWGVTQTN